MENQYILKQKISKTVKSIKYTIMHKDMTDEELSKYIGLTSTGITNAFIAKLQETIESYHMPIPLQVIIKGRYVGICKIALDKILPLSNIDMQKITTVMGDKCRGYIETFISNIKVDPAAALAEDYVNAMMEEFNVTVAAEEKKLYNLLPEDAAIYGDLKVELLKTPRTIK